MNDSSEQLPDRLAGRLPWLASASRPGRETTRKVAPLHDRLLVTRFENTAQGEGGIVIPDAAKELPMEGKVIAVGRGRVLDDGKRVPLEVRVGDRVLLGKYVGTEVKIDDKAHVIVREDEVLGIIR